METSLLMLLVAALFSLCAGFYGEVLLSAVFGAAYASGHVTLSILSIGAVGLTCSCASQLLQYQTNGRFGRDLNIAGAAVFLPSVVVLISIFGPIGAALGRTAVQLASCLAIFVRLGRLDGQRRASRTILIRIGLVVAILLLSLVGTEYSYMADGPAISLTRAMAFLVSLTAIVVAVCLGRNGLSWAGVSKVLKY